MMLNIYYMEICLKRNYDMYGVIYNLVIWAGSSVRIAAGYGLGGPGIEFRWGEIFRPSRPALGPTQPPVQLQWVPGLSRG